MADTSPLVLVAEDDKFYASIYQTKLEREGYRVLIAKDGAETLKMLETNKPDLLLLDLIMPVKDGFETLKELRALPLHKDLRVIVFSNLGQEDDIERVRQFGVIDYLVKTNISIQEMIDKVKQHLPVPAQPE
jgi:CheY-like chemotaxis protein